jgi:sulfoxide reductase catalytic subunit YedY
MIIKKAPDIQSAEITPQSLYLRRREFMQAAGITAAAALAGMPGRAEPAAAGGEKPPSPSKVRSALTRSRRP